MTKHEQNAVAAVMEYVRCKNAHDVDGLMAVVHEECEFDVVGIGVVFQGADEARQYHEDMFKAFPDYHLSGGPISIHDDFVVWEGTISGTHKGKIYGAAPTNRHFEVRTVAVFPVRDGKVAGERGYFDMMAVLAQLGIAAAPQLPW